MKLKLNLAPPVREIEAKIAQAFKQAKANRAEYIEIAYGTHQGELKKRILNFLMQKEYRSLYSRLVKSKEGWARVFVHFKWK